jgi:radical SAM protein with 4Fe4S-binding SPASM domain
MNHLPYINAIYSITSYGLSYIVHHPVGINMPYAVSIELTNLCNLHCPGCATGIDILTRSKGFMDVSTAEKTVTSLKNYLLSVNLYFQGEPMLHPQFFEIIDKFREMNGIISTNGHFLDAENCRKIAQSGLKKIIISYDGVSPETYSSYRLGGDHTRVTEGIRLLADELRNKKHSPKLELLFLVGRHNEHEADSASAFARSVNASFKIKSMQVQDMEDAERWVPSNETFSRYLKKNGVYYAKKTPTRGCIRMWTTPVITWDGNVVPCCYDKDADFILGNIHNQPFRQIWQGEKHQNFVKEVMHNRSSHKMCRQCSQGMRLFF